MDYSSFDCITRSSTYLKHDGSNWEFWKYCMELILKRRKLLTLAEGTWEQPDTNISDNTTSSSNSPSSPLDQWDKDNETTLLLITKSIDNQLRSLVQGETLAAKVWSRLKTYLNEVGTQSKIRHTTPSQNELPTLNPKPKSARFCENLEGQEKENSHPKSQSKTSQIPDQKLQEANVLELSKTRTLGG
jgi:hypothetical protein